MCLYAMMVYIGGFVAVCWVFVFYDTFEQFECILKTVSFDNLHTKNESTSSRILLLPLNCLCISKHTYIPHKSDNKLWPSVNVYLFLLTTRIYSIYSYICGWLRFRV